MINARELTPAPQFALMTSRAVGRLGQLIHSVTRAPRVGLARQLSTASSILLEDIYDVVIVGGGIAGLALATGLCSGTS